MPKQILASVGIQVVEENESGYLARIGSQPTLVLIASEMLATFEGCRADWNDFEPLTGKGALVSLRSSEQALSGVGGPSVRSIIRSAGYQFGRQDEKGACHFARCSDRFYWRVLIPNFDPSTVDILRPPSFAIGPLEITRIIPRPITATALNLDAPTINDAYETGDEIVQATLFNLAFLYDLTFETTSDLFRRRSPRRYRTTRRVLSSELPVVSGAYNHDLVRFYVRAISNSDPVNQFLSYYHVLEYFFVQLSDEELYGKLRSRMLTPGYRPTTRSLDSVIQDVVKHKRETDETEMLKLVVKKFIEPTDLAEFIQHYEAHLEEKLYSSQTSLFGEKFKTNLDPQHILGDVSRRVKAIRNALVHSSDRYERNERYVPSRSAEERLQKEIPLLKFLAEKVIVGCADISA
jgi:hypothetical protein